MDIIQHLLTTYCFDLGQDTLLLAQLSAEGEEDDAGESSEGAAANVTPDTANAPDSVLVTLKGDYFSTGMSRKLLKEDAFKIKAQLESFVTKELFPELKFTVGD